MPMKLSKDAEQQMITSIRQFFAVHMDEEIGDLKARLVLDYCVREIGPTIYNRAIADAQAFFQEKVSELDGTCHEREFGYWTKESR